MINQKKNKVKILMGFSGTLDSVVGSYLLKKQGYEVHNVGICFYAEEFEKRRQLRDENGDPIPFSPFHGVFQIKDIEKVKSLSDSLGIPFYAVQASADYQHYITDRIVAARIGGRSFSPKIHASRLIFEILLKKANLLGMDFISTGHYAKIAHNKTLKSTQLFVSNDLEYDQSYLLSSLDPITLDRLYLPLSDMRKQEVKKIADSLNLEFIDEKEDQVPLMERKSLAKFVEERASKKMFREGNLIDYKSEMALGDHDGIHHYALGCKDVTTKSGTPIDKDYQVIGFHYAAGVVYLGYLEDLKYDAVILYNVKYSKGTDLSQSSEVYIQISENGEKIAATLHPLNNRYCELKLKEARKGLLKQGDYIAFYNRSSKMGRVVGAGEVRTCGYIDGSKLRTFPKKRDELNEDETKKQVDIYAFKF